MNVNGLPFEVRAALGLVPGASTVNKFGRNPTVGMAEETLWVQGGLYTYTDATTPVSYFISSSDNGDTQDYEIMGLGPSFVPQTVTVTAVGQTETEIVGSTWIRIFRIRNMDSTNNAGTIYVYEDDTVVAGVPQTATLIRAVIGIGLNQTEMALYTVPANKTAIMYEDDWAASSSTGILRLYERPEGGVFRIQKNRSTFSGNTGRKYTIPRVFQEKTDIELRGETTAGSFSFESEFDLLIVDLPFSD